jgi:acetyl esterase/lipase
VWVVIFALSTSIWAAQPKGKPAPTHPNVAYGPHERNVIDVWLAESTAPTPLVLYIHGGGFRGGSKESLRADVLRQLLDSGISVAGVNYRLISHKRLPAAHHDCRRALQFLRSKAGEWNFDKKRVGAFGGSAGAQLSMWLAFHDEMAKPDSDDPLERESTRLACVATNGGQTTMDFDWWQKWIPGYDKPHRDPHEAFEAQTKEEMAKLVAEVSALALISADDPPIFMSYGMAPDAPVPTDPQRARGWKVHHVMFGVKLKEKMDELGVEADLKHPGASPKYESIPQFFKTKLLK